MVSASAGLRNGEYRSEAMNDADKIVAATLAAARCAAAGRKTHEEYVVEYEAFLQLLEQRATEHAAQQTTESAPTAASPVAAASSSQSIYESPNGDRWQLIRDATSGRQFVQHEANPSSGGRVTETSVEEFLRRGATGPEHAALRHLLDRQAQNG